MLKNISEKVENYIERQSIMCIEYESHDFCDYEMHMIRKLYAGLVKFVLLVVVQIISLSYSLLTSQKCNRQENLKKDCCHCCFCSHDVADQRSQ